MPKARKTTKTAGFRVDSKHYIDELARRAGESHVYRKYQLIGLEIAAILGDEKHKALYIKLAKEGNQGRLLQIAKEVADRKGVKNRGAYFMKLVTMEKNN